MCKKIYWLDGRGWWRKKKRNEYAEINYSRDNDNREESSLLEDEDRNRSNLSQSNDVKRGNIN